MHTLDQFTMRTHARSEGIMPTESVGVASARELVSRIDEARMAELAAAARAYLPHVLPEINSLNVARLHHPMQLAQRALLFGISTPNRDERESIDWALAAAPHYGMSPAQLVKITYRDGKVIGMYTAIARAIGEIYERFRTLILSDLVPAILEMIHGIGPKVARMIAAVANPYARVWTVDLWHIRQMLWAAGMEYRVRASVDSAAYAILEARWLEYYQRYFADVPVWAAQWATWNVADGRHNPHSMLWSDLAA